MNMKKSKLEASCSSPIATVEEIQKRLLRPRDSQPLSSFNSSQNHQFFFFFLFYMHAVDSIFCSQQV